MIKRRYDAKTGKLGAAYPDCVTVPEPYITLTNAKNDEISADDKNIYYYIDGKFVTKDKKEVEEKERVAALNMTKLDFYKYVIKPNGISYGQLKQIIESDSDMQAEWDLCGRVYRGNDFLSEENIQQFLPNVTGDMLDEIFKKYGEEGGNL